MTDHSHNEGDDRALDPEEMLALLTQQQRSVEGQIAGFVPLIITAWGIAWLVGFGALWLIDGLGDAFGLPLPVAAWTFGVLIGGASFLSAWLGIRSSRGIRSTPAAAFTGTVYGVTWSAGSLAIYVFGVGLSVNGMPSELMSFFFPSAFVIFAGVMYLLAGAIWHAVPSVVLGGWTLLIGGVAPFFGYPNHYLFLAIAGGLGFLALGLASIAHFRRLKNRMAGQHDG
ncbi:hypothetical protein GCM10027416_10190 [Okibacterium endophyticum]